MINTNRLEILSNKINYNNNYVLYWMQASQRINYNHALFFAVKKANELKKPLIVVFYIFKEFNQANNRHYYFMLEGIKELFKKFKDLNISFIVNISSNPLYDILKIEKNACLTIIDAGYLNFQKENYQYLKKHANNAIIKIESNIIVPITFSYAKEVFNARILRLKINKLLPQFLNENLNNNFKVKHSINFQIGSLNEAHFTNLNNIIKMLNIDKSLSIFKNFKSGEDEAINLLNNFIENKLPFYNAFRNDPNKNINSFLSIYLHFGQISPVFIAQKIISKVKDSSIYSSFLEELIVRRELATNFTYYNSNYFNLKSLNSWAIITLENHKLDKRPYVYSLEELENAKTHDKVWNACMLYMVKTGFLHSYMRMYWGKKIIEWTDNYINAFKIMIYLNNKYFYDGRDSNSYAGVLWCFGKHDRAWKERTIFGKVRYMNTNSLKKLDTKKFISDAYTL